MDTGSVKTILLAAHRTETPGVLEKTAAYLERKGHQLLYVLDPLIPGALPTEVQVGKIKKTYRIPAWAQYFLEGIAATRVLSGLKGKQPIDLMICFDPLSFFHLYIWRRVLKIKKTVYYNVDYSSHRFANPVLNYIYVSINRFAYRKCDYFFSISERFMEDMDPQGVHKGRNFLLRHTVDTKGIPSLKRTPNSMVFAGTLNSSVDFEELFQALEQLNQEKVDFTFDVYGRGDKLVSLQDQVKKAGLDKKVQFKGVVNNEQLIKEILPTYEIGLCPYIKKGSKVAADHMFTGNDLTTKLVEYLAAGLPIVTTSLFPAFEVVSDRKLGFLVSDKMEWYTALHALLTDPNLKKQYVANATSYAKRYDEEEVFGPIFTTIWR